MKQVLIAAGICKEEPVWIYSRKYRKCLIGPWRTQASRSAAEKKLELFRKQKALLDTFLSSGAISQAQHDYSLNCLIEKMGITEGQ